MRGKLAALIVVAALAGLAVTLPRVRRTVIHAITTYDAQPSEPAPLPGGTGPGLPRTPRTRVVLIDGLAASTAQTLAAWNRVCDAGLRLAVDVGFPTVSLPVEIALWSGLTQQQTGITTNRALEPPFDRRGIPAQIAGSVAIAENHGFIVRALGFAQVEPAAEPGKPMKDADEAAWDKRWEARAKELVHGSSPLVFVHVLRVDVEGHRSGMSATYVELAHEADALLAQLIAEDPGARWFVLSDHGHIPGGGHGGEEQLVREVEACIAGPGIRPARGGLVHVIDLARALADSTGATLDPASRARPMSAAMANPLGADQAVPPIGLGTGVFAIFLLVAGLGAASWGVRRWWLAPWWFAIAVTTLLVVRGLPTLSTPMIYKPEGRDMYLTWLPALGLVMITTWFGVARTSLWRVLAAQLALPAAAAAGAIAAAGAWSAVFGAEVAPVVPRFTAWTSPLILLLAHGAGAVALAVLASVVRPASDRRAPAAPPRSAPGAG